MCVLYPSTNTNVIFLIPYWRWFVSSHLIPKYLPDKNRESYEMRISLISSNEYCPDAEARFVYEFINNVINWHLNV